MTAPRPHVHLWITVCGNDNRLRVKCPCGVVCPGTTPVRASELRR